MIEVSWAGPFVVGVLVGVALMWVAVVIAQAREAERLPERFR